jgi:hypothetical protein
MLVWGATPDERRATLPGDEMLLSLEQERDEGRAVEEIVAVHAAYMDAMERVLGAPSNCLVHADAEAAKVWVAVLRSE